VRHSDKLRHLAQRQVDAGIAQARFEQRNADNRIAGLALFRACAGTYRLPILELLVRRNEEYLLASAEQYLESADWAAAESGRPNATPAIRQA
jgi:hypothetical protein